MVMCPKVKYKREATMLDPIMTERLFPSLSDIDPHPKVITTRIMEGNEKIYPAWANFPPIPYA